MILNLNHQYRSSLNRFSCKNSFKNLKSGSFFSFPGKSKKQVIFRFKRNRSFLTSIDRTFPGKRYGKFWETPSTVVKLTMLLIRDFLTHSWIVFFLPSRARNLFHSFRVKPCHYLMPKHMRSISRGFKNYRKVLRRFG